MSRMQSGHAKTLVFDLDGTLLDTLGDLAAAVHALRHELQLPPRDDSFVRRGIGYGLDALLRHSMADLPGADWTAAGTAEGRAARNDERELAPLRKRWRELYAGALTTFTQPYPGVPSTLTRLRAHGYRFAIASNKPEDFCHRLVEHFDWNEIFPVVLGGDSAAKRKPDPAPLLLACERLGVDPAEACMIGDSPPDILAGRAAGFRQTIACTWGYTKPDEVRALPASHCIDHFTELTELLA